jgi:hypothetical protein
MILAAAAADPAPVASPLPNPDTASAAAAVKFISVDRFQGLRDGWTYKCGAFSSLSLSLASLFSLSRPPPPP